MKGCKVNNNNKLSPALIRLLDSCLVLKTTEAKILATYLNRSPATIRTEFQRILYIMDVNCRYAALKTAEEEGWLSTKNATANH
jgi:hypothetical protein